MKRHKFTPRLSRLALAGATIFLLLAAAGCSHATIPGGMTRSRAGLAYTDGSFSATVRGSCTRLSEDGYTGDPARAGASLTGLPQTFAATIMVTQTEDRQSMTITVAYSEPASLAGLTVTADEPRTEGAIRSVTVTLDDLSFSTTDSRLDHLLAPAYALLAPGDITAVSRDDEDLRTVTLTDAATGTRTVCHFAPDRALPVLVTAETTDRRLELRVSEENS